MKQKNQWNAFYEEVTPLLLPSASMKAIEKDIHMFNKYNLRDHIKTDNKTVHGYKTHFYKYIQTDPYGNVL